ncbi:MAG: hypothetical protein B7C55_13790 [Actinomycetales bacterium mxb001]|nr:MAG: hypothetical protein B7C55_13790 [Actinomycetales bacterium mxb001]
MSAPPRAVAAYYKALPSPQRETMLAMRERILSVIPDAVECIKYQMPTFVVEGVPLCGIMAHKRHVGYYPYSGRVLAQFPELIEKYGGTKAALHVPVDKPLPKATIAKLIRARRALG